MVWRILLVEDEENLQEVIKMNLELEGYEVIAVDNGLDALRLAKEQRFNLVVLDVMLPEMDGFHVCEQIRLDDPNIPVLFLTAKDSTQDKITGLKKGGDDYMTKPFHLEEFLLRVRVLLRHSVKGTTEESSLRTYQFGKNEINFVTYKATTQNGEIDLTRKETKLLKLLIERNNEVVSREHILQFVWGYDVFPSTRTIDNFILAFRKYFEDDPKEPIYFHSVRGVGYKFTNPGN
ncbi:MAG: response regulator transcription factor [Chitinophagales bacterium]|jgi:two-component system alkaline phosphatase synthesis response regulator PhoP|nr:response regulator transcription factor [Sphingobacteriales bacterium]MBP7534551.1 response regulator transcription factor [Chitinophagales bacterium]